MNDAHSNSDSLPQFHFRKALALLRLAKNAPLAYLGLTCVLVSTGATIATPYFVGVAIDQGLIPKDWLALRRATLVVLAVEILRFASLTGASYFLASLGQRIMFRLRSQIFGHLHSLAVEDYEATPSSRHVTRATNDIAAISELFSAGFVAIIGNFLTLFGTLAALVLLDIELGFIGLSTFPILAGLAIYYSRKLALSYRDTRTKLSRLNSFVAETLSGIKVLHLFGKESSQLRRFREVNSDYANAQIQTIQIFAYFQPIITIFGGISVALIIWFGGIRAQNGELPLGVLVAYTSYCLALMQPIREIADKWNLFLSGMASAERVFKLLSVQPDPSIRIQSDISPLRLRGEIRFENVHFRYGGGPWVLRDISFSLEPGMRLGIVGPSGVGKSSIVQLLLRFREPQKGRIFLDGLDLTTLDKQRLRAAIGYVQQDVTLFSGTIAENIHLWSPGSSDDDVKDLIHRLGFDDTFKNFHDGPNTLLVERAANISEGQKQVIAFLRAGYKKPSIWILDEATSNIDPGTEARIQDALMKETSCSTVIAVAHRIETIREFDKIAVLSEGRLVEFTEVSKSTYSSVLGNQTV